MSRKKTQHASIEIISGDYAGKKGNVIQKVNDDLYIVQPLGTETNVSLRKAQIKFL